MKKMTLILVNLAGIMERADEALLPGVYREVGAALHTDPTGLGSLTLFRSFVQSSCFPLAAYLSLHHNRAHVIALGAFLWSAATFLVAISSTFFQVAVSRALNGVGLAIVIPAIQSLVADSTDDGNRGIAFGWLQLAGNFGSIIGGFFSLLLASTSFMGIPGWRIAFHLVALVSIVVGILVRLFTKDPCFSDEMGKSSHQISHKSTWLEVKDLIQEAKSVMRIPSFQIIVAQGVTGSFPWSALSFASMWLELIGFSHKETALLLGMFVVASSLGGLFGGNMGDILAKRFPNAGRIILAQISSGSAIPLAALLMLVLPDDPSKGFIYGLVLFIMGLCISWNGPATNNWVSDTSGSAIPLAAMLMLVLPDDPSKGFIYGLVLFIMGFGISWNGPATNNPIFAEIVPERSRTSIYALDRSFESILSSFAPPIVGILSQHVYGYKPVPKGSSEGVEISIDRENAASLAKALYTAIGLPMLLCCFIYSFLYCTYPRDRERARMDSLIQSEMQKIESDNLPAGGDYSQVQLSELDELYERERSVIELDYGGDEAFEIEDNDEMTLLPHQLSSSNLIDR